MKKRILSLLIIILMLSLASPSLANDLSARLKGKILLQVEGSGEAWYINPDNENRYFLGRPADAFALMRELGLGISNKDFNSFNGIAPLRLSGKILLQAEENGEAWYVDPTDLKMHFMGRPADAFALMRELGLGISNGNLDSINIASGFGIPAKAARPEEVQAGQEEEEEAIICPETKCSGSELISYTKENEECAAATDDCSDCSCECGGYNIDETADNNNCADLIDNDCDGLVDSEEGACLQEGTQVGGEIVKNTTWTLAASPYIVIADVAVAANAVLLIEPGVVVKFMPAGQSNALGGYELLVRGSLTAKGTADKAISFLSGADSPGLGDWWGIEVVDGGTVELEYAEVKYARNGISAVNNRLANVKNSVISQCETAIRTSGPGEISDNNIENNHAGIVVLSDIGSARDSGTYLSYNIRLIDIKYNTIQNNAGDMDNPDQAGVVLKNITTPDVRLNLEFNEISYNTSGINFTGTDYFNNLTIDKNNIVGSDNYNIWFDTGGQTVTLENNWWGTTALDPITDKIFDRFDVSGTLPQADYQPISLVAHESAGVR